MIEDVFQMVSCCPLLVHPNFPAGVGVPLMLTYVYGVVPMSLCRNGWCRQQAEPPDAHRIQLEDLASCKYRSTD